MAAILCRCGHRKYKHSLYPLDWPFCKGVNAPRYSIGNCECQEYDGTGSLELLEWLASRSVGKNKKTRKV